MALSMSSTNSFSSIHPFPFLSNAFNSFLKFKPAKDSGSYSLTISYSSSTLTTKFWSLSAILKSL
jgi:hypothetical protein